MKNTTCKLIVSGTLLSSLLVLNYRANAQKTGDLYPKPAEVIEKGIELHDEEKYKEAILKFKLVNENDSFYHTALYEMALSLQKDKQYELAAQTALKGLALNTELDKLFLLNYAATLDEWGKKDSALKVYDYGLQKYPFAHAFIHEKATAYAKAKDLDNALKYYAEAIKMNPYSSSTHWRIGVMAASAKKPALALMALNMYCLIVQNEEAVIRGLQLMEKIADNEFTPDEEIDAKYFEFTKDLDEVDLIIYSKAATQKKYKAIVKLNYNVVKQMQVLHEKLPADFKSNNWLLDFYVNFYQNVWNEGMFEAATLHSFRYVGDKDVQSKVKSKTKEIDVFQTWASKRLNDLRDNKKVLVNGKEMPVKLWFEDGYMRAIGEENASGQNTGPWKYYTTNYILSAEGNFINDKKDGTWRYYYPTGELRKTEEFVDGKLTGEVREYYKNGALNEVDQYKNDDIVGELLLFNPNNTLKAKMNVANNKLDGIREGYNNLGILTTREMYKIGKNEGIYQTYHTNGQINLDTKATNDNLHGPAIYYHPNGKVKLTGTFNQGNRDGEWKWTYPNGVLETVGYYKNGKETGNWKYYYDNGNLEKEEIYENGAKKGVYKLYDLNGVLYGEVSVKGNNVDAYKYFDAKGKVIAEAKTQGGKLNFVRYNAFRHKVIEGQIINGFDEGVWKYYYENGALEYEVNFTKGKKDGLLSYYYRTGDMQYQQMYVDDEKSGYYKSVYLNGNTEVEGYYENGERVGVWLFYNANGTISAREFYIDGEVHGKGEGFTEDGKPEGYAMYSYGMFNNYYQADTTGKLYNQTNLKFGTGNYTLKTPSGRVSFFGKYVGGKRDSLFTGYYPNGKVSVTEQHKYGKLNGTFKRFHENGQISSVGRYLDGEQDSIWNYYDENGKITRIANLKAGNYNGKYVKYYANGKVALETNYLNDMLHGTYKKYSYEGTLIIEAQYNGGVMEQYTYLGKDGKPVAPILLSANETADIKTYFPNGNLALSFSLKNGLYHGKHERYFENGKLNELITYVNGNFEGDYKFYAPSGTLLTAETYYYDERQGTGFYYNEAGKLIKEINYLLGVKHGVSKTYDPATGKVLSTTNYMYNK